VVDVSHVCREALSNAVLDAQDMAHAALFSLRYGMHILRADLRGEDRETEAGLNGTQGSNPMDVGRLLLAGRHALPVAQQS
jgi:hypothetical protein